MPSRQLQVLRIGPDAHRVDSDAHQALRAMLAGAVSLLPVPATDTAEADRLARALAADRAIDPAVALVVATSGTTGTPKGAMLTAAALTASASATHTALGGPGAWLLALPPHHIAGLQVILRSIHSGYPAHAVDVTDGFDVATFTRAANGLEGPRRYLSLVPTQLRKIVDDPAATAAVADFDAVLVGGAATPPALYQRAVDAGIAVRRTYGMSETCGGCVYDGIALPGTTIDIVDGRVWLGGPTVALGYRNYPDHSAFARPGWFRTDDLGEFDSDGRLRIVGRADEAITCGGLTVVPQVVEQEIARVPQVAECAVFGVDDERLGQRVVAAIVPVAPQDSRSGDPSTEWERLVDAVSEQVRATLGDRAVPREYLRIDALPLRGPGKVDRSRLRTDYPAAER